MKKKLKNKKWRFDPYWVKTIRWDRQGGHGMSKCFEDFKVGETFRTPAKTMTDVAITMMVSLAGFTHPLFHDEEYAKGTPFGSRVAPGRLTLFTMGGLEEQIGMWRLGLCVESFHRQYFPGLYVHLSTPSIQLGHNYQKGNRCRL